MAPENTVLKPALSRISGIRFNCYLWSNQLALNQILSFHFLKTQPDFIYLIPSKLCITM